MKLGRALAMAVVLFAAACSSSGDADSTQPQASAVAEVAPPTASFCADANGFVTSSDVRLVTAPDAQIFADIDVMLAGLGADAPETVAVEVETLRDGFSGIREAYAAVDFDPSATLQLPAELLQSNSVAVRNLEDYLVDQCDLAAVRSTQIADIVEAFGLQDEALAECFHTQLGDIANIESSSLTPELMITEICGTSILGLLSGEGETDS